MTNDLLSNKNCLVTGATGGLGREICRELVKKNCNVFLTSTSNTKLNIFKKELSKNYPNSKIFLQQADLRKIIEVVNLIKSVKEKMTVDIVINCAGKFSSKAINKLSLEEFEDIFNINVKAPFIISKNFVQSMKKRKWGRMIYIGSSSSYLGYKNTSAYCSSKHGILGLSRALYEELKSSNVRVYSFSPGSIKTKMGKQIKNQNFETFLEPKEIAKFIIFTISFDSQLTTSEIQFQRLNPK